MALVLADRVQQTGTANTTVSFTLSGSVTGFQSFSVIGDTNTTYYAATDASGNWEVGIGTYSTTGPTLTRTTILSSSNSGSAVTFSGTVNVFVTYPSEKSVNYDAADNVGIGTTNPTARLNIVDATSQAALRITQTGGGNALVVEDESPDSTPFVVDTTGRLITGATQAYTNYLDGFANTARNPTVQFNGTSLSTASSSLTNWASADSPPLLVLAKSKSGTVGTMTSTFSVGDVAGAIQFSASDNTNFIPTALIEAQIDGTPGTGDMPGRLVFSTTADGGSLPTERMRISSDGRLQINGENTLTSSLVATANTFPLNLAQTAYQFRAEATFGTANTNAVGFGSTYQLPATGAFSSSYQLFAGTITSGGATLTNNYGVYVDLQTVGTNIYGVYSAINTGTNRWNFYAGGTADNVFVGNVGIGLATTPVAPLHVALPEVGGEAVRLSWNTGSTTQGEASIGFSTTLSATYPNAKISGQEIDTSDYRGNLLFYTRDTNSDVAPILRMTIGSDGLVELASTSGLDIGRTAVTSPAATDGNVFSGTYTPSITNTTNVAASIPYRFQYMRVGNTVTVSGRINIDPTASATASEIGISLPIASAFPVTADGTSSCAGVGSVATTAAETSSGGIFADTTNDRATFRFLSGGTAARDYYVTFTYLVI